MGSVASISLEHDDVRALVRQGQEAGFVTHEEIVLALGDDVEPGQLEELHVLLEEAQIEVVEVEPEPESAPAPVLEPSRGRSRRTRSSSFSRTSAACRC